MGAESPWGVCQVLGGLHKQGAEAQKLTSGT